MPLTKALALASYVLSDLSKGERYTASIQVLGYTGVYRWARHPHHIKLGVYRGYTAQKVYRCIQVSSLGKGPGRRVYRWVYRVYSHPSVGH